MTFKIECKWMKDRRILINPDGQVWPCCFLANPMYFLDQTENPPNGHIRQKKHPLMKEYYDRKEDFNIFNRSMEEILSDPWFEKTLPETWNSPDTVFYQCNWFCKK